MTLEQIKDKQEQINKSLYVLLEDTMIVVERLVGEQPKSESNIKSELYSGLIDELSTRQDETVRVIEKLNEYRQALAYGVYSPVEVECAAVKSAH